MTSTAVQGDVIYLKLQSEVLENKTQVLRDLQYRSGYNFLKFDSMSMDVRFYWFVALL